MKYIYLLVIFMCITSKLFSQCSFKDYEKYVEQNCFNCTIFQEDSLIHQKITFSNSKLTKIHNTFYNRLKNEFNVTLQAKKLLTIKYEKLYRDLKKTRSEVLLFYRYIGKNSNSQSNELLAYWFYTDKITDILLDVQETLLGGQY